MLWDLVGLGVMGKEPEPCGQFCVTPNLCHEQTNFPWRFGFPQAHKCHAVENPLCVLQASFCADSGLGLVPADKKRFSWG